MDYQRIYEEMGISPEVIAYSEKILKNLESRFKEIDEIAEINQLKVLQALQKAKVSDCLRNPCLGHCPAGKSSSRR